MFFGRRKKEAKVKDYDRENLEPAVRCSICTGEQVAGFRDIHTGRFYEELLILNDSDLQSFKDKYGLEDVEKFY